MKLRCKTKKPVYADCSATENEDKVLKNVVYTPKEMYDLSSKGMSVSIPDNGNFYDGDSNATFDLLPESRRGVDPADLWQMQQASRKRISQAYKTKKNEKNTTN